MRLRTAVCDLFDITYPILLAGMGGAAGPELTAAVSNAGGLGILGAAGCTPDELDAWITRTKTLTDRPFGVDTLLPASVPDRLEPTPSTSTPRAPTASGTEQRPSYVPEEARAARNRFMEREGLEKPVRPPGSAPEERPGRRGFVRDFFNAQIEVILDHAPTVYVAGLGVPSPEFIARGHAKGMKFMGVAGQSRHVAKLRAAGVDAIVAQGHDGGGHNSPIGTMALIPQAVDTAGDLPVIAAGGISDGRGVAAAFMLGALGVWIGTRFLATEEANLPRFQKEAIMAAADRDTMVSRSVSGKPARMIRGKWAEFYERGEATALPMPLQGMVSAPVTLTAEASERVDVWPGFAGQGVGLVKDVRPAAEVFNRLLAEALERLDGTHLPGVDLAR